MATPIRIPTAMTVKGKANQGGSSEASQDLSADLGFLGVLQLADSFFPSGLYTLSHGLEAFIQHDLVTTADDLEPLLRTYVEHLVGPADGVAIVHAHRAALLEDLTALCQVDRRLTAVKLTRESREAAMRIGKRVLATALSLANKPILQAYMNAVEEGEAPGNAAIAYAATAAALAVPPREATLAALYAFAVGLLGASMRLIRVDHVQVQGILARLRPHLIRVVDAHVDTPLEEMRSWTPLIDIMAMRHEQAHVRLFIS